MWAEEIVAQLTKEKTHSHNSIYTHADTHKQTYTQLQTWT